VSTDNRPRLTDDGRPFAERMIEHIRLHWGDDLGADRWRLRSEQGMVALSRRTRRGFRGRG